MSIEGGAVKEAGQGTRCAWRRTGRCTVGIALFLLSLVGSMTLADWALGALGFARHWHVLMREPDVLIEGPPRFVTNAEGAVDYPVEPRRPGERRGIITGDGLTEGWNVSPEERYSAFLQEALGFRVINVAKGGVGPVYFLHSFDYFAAKYEPDFFFIPIFANDLIESDPEGDDYNERLEMFRREMTEAFSLLDRGARWAWPHLFVRFQKKLGFYPDIGRYFRVSLPVLRAAEPPRATPVIDGMIARARQEEVSPARIAQWRSQLTQDDVEYIETTRLSDGILQVAIPRPRYWAYSLDIEGEEAERSWKTLRYQLDLLLQHARARRIRPFLIYLPHPVQYDPDYIRPLYKRMGVVLRPEWYGVPSEFQKRLRTLAEDTGTPYLDGQAVFLAHRGPKAPLYFSAMADPHMSPAGAKVLGQAIANWLKTNHLLDDPPPAR